MRMLPSKMVPFSVTIAFSSGRAKKIQKHNVWTRILLKRRKKIPRFQAKTDTCGPEGNYVRNQNKTIER